LLAVEIEPTQAVHSDPGKEHCGDDGIARDQAGQRSYDGEAHQRHPWSVERPEHATELIRLWSPWNRIGITRA